MGLEERKKGDRIKTLVIDPGSLWFMMRGELRISNLPEDCELLNVSHQVEYAGICLVIRSETFEFVKYGTQVPLFEAKTEAVRSRRNG